jgi:class 3 adenylate cyclase
MSMPIEAAAPCEQQLAVVFADVSGSTRLYEALGDAQALATIAGCLELAATVAKGYGGRLVKTIGDEAMLVFSAADAALEAAGEIQSRMAALPPRGNVGVTFRVGMHCGTAIVTDGDVFGDCVNVAARMVALAKSGQVIVSEAAITALSPWLRRRLREVDVLTVKGKEKDIRIFELLWQDATDEVTAMAARAPARASRLQLKHGAREIHLDERATSLTLGLHGRIERRRDKFVLIDQSSNGTFVTIEGDRELQLRREELMLRGRGRISFGHPYAADPAETLDFVWIEGGD